MIGHPLFMPWDTVQIEPAWMTKNIIIETITHAACMLGTLIGGYQILCLLVSPMDHHLHFISAIDAASPYLALLIPLRLL